MDIEDSKMNYTHAIIQRGMRLFITVFISLHEVEYETMFMQLSIIVKVSFQLFVELSKTILAPNFSSMYQCVTFERSINILNNNKEWVKK